MEKGNITEASLPVEGMSCASCAVDLETALRKLEAVKSANVNFANHQLTVSFNTSFGLEKICKTAQSLGFNLLTEQYTWQQLADRKKTNFKKLQQKTILMGALTVPVVVIGMFFMHWWFGAILSAFLTIPIVFILGKNIFYSAFKQIKIGKANMDTLVALGTSTAFFYSGFNLLKAAFSDSTPNHVHVYFEASAVIILFVTIGKLLEEKAKMQTGIALNSLLNLQPNKVIKLNRKKMEQEIPAHLLRVGDWVLVKAGMQIPADGKVIEGISDVDERAINGEPLPITKTEGQNVFAGSINLNGQLILEAKAVGQQTLLGKVISQVQHSQSTKAPIQKLVDKIASKFVPIVLVVAFITFCSWLLLSGISHLNMAINAAVSVLVIACPCALGLATPTALIVGIGAAAKKQLLIKDASSLETANQIKVIMLDKTGTITSGVPKVNLVWFANSNSENFENVSYQLSKKSNHPISKALSSFFASNNSKNETLLTDFKELPGIGISAKFGQDTLFSIGNRKIHPKAVFPSNLPNSNEPTVWLFQNKEVVGAFWLADSLKPDSILAIQNMQKAGYEVCMLTGDNIQNAKLIANEVGIKSVYASLLPNEKANIIANYQAKGLKVAMIGDGINDSQAMAIADLGIAMGDGADIALEAANITLLRPSLNLVNDALQLSKKTVKTIRQNLFWAFLYNVVSIPIAAGVFYPFFGITLSPMLASAAMAFSSVSVVLNSLRLRNA